MFALVSSASAQTSLDLRGEVSEQSINGDLLGNPLTEANPFDTDVEPSTQRQRQNRRQVAINAEAEPTSAGREGRADADDPVRNARAGTDNMPTGAIEGRGRRAEEDAFAPIGIRAGTFILRPRIEQGIGWTSNASSSAGGESSTYSETGLRLNAITDWSRHSANVDADLNWRKSVSGEWIDEVEGGIAGELRLELGHDFNLRTTAGYRVREESASSPSAIAGVEDRPLRHTFDGSLGLSKDVGKVRFGVTGALARNIYDDAKLTNGTTVSQGDRDSTLATARLRVGYEISPALRPFVEAEAGRRFYDEKQDGLGYERSADRYALRTGVELDLREKLTGEASIGWLTERPDDGRLENISGFTAAGRLAWSPVRGTTVELNGSTEVEGTTAAGESGSLLYAGSLAVIRDLRSDLTGRAALGVQLRDYANSSGRDTTTWGEASLTWWMNRYAGITGRARHEIQRSNLPNRDYDATSVYLGMTFQR